MAEYIQIVERHSESDATHDRLAKIGPLMKGESRFYNLDVLDERTE